MTTIGRPTAHPSLAAHLIKEPSRVLATHPDGADLSIRLPIIADLQRRQLYERVVAHGPEIVDRQDSGSLAEYHELLKQALGDDQVEPLTGLQNEIAHNQDPLATARYICILLRDPEAGNRIVSGVYGSVQGGVLASRFLVTVHDNDKKQEYRGTGISQETCRLFIAEANRWSVSQRGQAIWASVAECVEESETFFNRLLGMRRLYALEPDGAALREIHYELPHLGEWRSDGTPLNRRRQPVDQRPQPLMEHLQIAATRYVGRLPFGELEQIVSAFWREWYVRPVSQFDSHAIWETHYKRVIEETLQARILGPLRPHGELVLLSRAERNERRAQGQVIHDLRTKETSAA